jgi:hypothetical protein
MATVTRREARMKPVTAVALLVLCCLQVPPAAGQAVRLLPQDEAVRQPEFFSFRAQLLAALARRDTAALMSVVAPEIHNTFGDDNGAVAFRRLWRLDSADSRLWQELTTVLALGGTFEHDSSFVAPYVFSRWPSQYDSFEYLAVIASDVRIRAGPDATAPVVGKAGFEVVRRARTRAGTSAAADSQEWEPVQLEDGRVGYIARRFLRSPVSYRAIFARRGTRWTMVTLIAGD